MLVATLCMLSLGYVSRGTDLLLSLTMNDQ